MGIVFFFYGVERERGVYEVKKDFWYECMIKIVYRV